MQKQFEPCQEVGPGGNPAADCRCPACVARRVSETIGRLGKAARTTKAAPEPAAPAEPAKNAEAVREEERLRDSVSEYLLKDVPEVRWDDIVGADEARVALREALEAGVKHPELYKHYGMRVPRGVLLEGSPGCGKTMFAKAAARAMLELHGAERPAMLRISGPEIQTPYVGMTEKIIREVFAYARAYAARYGAPLLIFIDEADALLPARDGFNGNSAQPWQEANVATFLAEMDGIAGTGAFVLLATNRVHAMDAAVLRPGRVDVKVRVPRPNRDACVAILKQALHNAPLAHDHVLKQGRLALKQQVPGSPLTTLSERAVDLLLSPVHTLVTMQSDRGPLHLTMAHIVSGALVAELGNRTRSQAFRRDLQAGTITGVQEEDFTAAVYALVHESERGTYPDAIRDLCLAAGATVAHNGPGDSEFDEEHLLPFQRAKAPKGGQLN